VGALMPTFAILEFAGSVFGSLHISGKSRA